MLFIVWVINESRNGNKYLDNFKKQNSNTIINYPEVSAILIKVKGSKIKVA